MPRTRTFAAAAVAAASLALGIAAAAPASATTTNTTCTTWSDSNTFGGYCSEGGTYFRAVAKCNNGQTVYGDLRRVGGGTWSYAYCTSVNSSLYGGNIAIA
ncbi:hypothetical protein ABZW03_25305 [Kitasatospora sp. NPDC004799]|uniref:hypothetical protein n=1 Tax=Kitasatospora sp. NPDC004799 TaxID=3154460 RepID=UPI0033AFEFA9